jgi:hypothetical protein
MGQPKRIDSRVVDQDIDLAVSKLDRPSRHFSGTRSIPKVRRNEVRLSTRCSYFGNGLFSAFHVATYDHNMDGQLGQFVRYGATNTTCSSCDKRGCSHFPKSFSCRTRSILLGIEQTEQVGS